MGTFVVNRTGLSVPVWAGNILPTSQPSPNCHQYDRSNRVGTLFPNEFYRAGDFVWCPVCFRETQRIRFLSPTGWREGFTHLIDVGEANWPMGDFMVHFGRRQETIGGTVQQVYAIQNRAEELRAIDGTHFATLAVGTEIATDSSTMGQTWHDHWLIRWVRRGGVWTHADNRAGHNTHAFVDTGLRVGSSPTTNSIRTSLVA